MILKNKNILPTLLPVLLALPAWVLLYLNLQNIADFIISCLPGMDQTSQLSESLRFFLFELPKVLMLLVLIIFFVGIIRSWFSPEKTRKILEGKSAITGNVLASMLGIVTPFCSCSAIPLFLGFVESGVPLGVTFSFLIAAPMINEVAIILLFGLFGWKTAFIYVGTGLIIAISSGWIIGKLNPVHWVQDWVYNTQMLSNEESEEALNLNDRIRIGMEAVKEIVGKVWLYEIGRAHV